MQFRTRIIVPRAALTMFFAATMFLFVAGTSVAAQTVTSIYSFGSMPDTFRPSGALVFDAAGNAYGTSLSGGASGYGGIFQLSPPAVAGGSWTETVIHSFGPSGATTAGANQLAIDRFGNLYGTTQFSRVNGTVFRLARPRTSGGSWRFSVLHAFGRGKTDGSNPVAGVVLIGNKIYGTTFRYGPNGAGIVYQLEPSGTGFVESIIYSFPGYSGDGANPAGLTRDNAGNLYVVTVGGSGANASGGVFKLTAPASGSGPWTETVLFSGDETTYGNQLSAAPVFDKSGALWGTTNYKGLGNAGTLFRLRPPSVPGGPWTPTLIHAFDLNAEGEQNGGLAYDRSSNTVYGMNPGFNGTCGTIFQVSRSSGAWTYSSAYTFSNSAIGCNPFSPLALDQSGNLFGVTIIGGANGSGSAFQFIP